MICPCITPANSRWSLWRSTARAVLGIPDYEAYLVHHAARHEGAPAMTREAFIEARLAARFGGGGMRCC